MKRKKNKKILLIILLIIGLILVGTGTSLAYFSYKDTIGDKILLGDDIYVEIVGDDEINMNPESIYALTMGGSNPAFEYQFMVKGHNTNEKPIYYALYLEHGEDIPDGKVKMQFNSLSFVPNRISLPLFCFTYLS